MFGWEFPPHISGGLGTACHGLTKALSEFPDVELTFVVPKIWGDEDQSDCVLIGADQIPVLHDQIKFDDIESKVEFYSLRSELVPYLGSNEFLDLKSKGISEEKQLVEITEEGRFIFAGDYGSNLFQEVRNFAIVAESLSRELEFDVIHVHDWMTFPAGMAAKRISGKPLVVHIHSTEFDRSGMQVNSAICAFEKEGMDHADKIITVSNFTKDILIRNYHIYPEKISTVYNAAEPVPDGKEREFLPISNEKIVSFLGRITMQKGPEYFVDAASLVLRRMKNVRFVMAGKGDLQQAMIRRATELNIAESFDFPGFLSDEEVIRLFHRSDLFAMPSVSEPFGIVALEAIQANLPVIISKQSGVSEVLNHVLKIDYWDVSGLADAIYYLLNDQIFADKLVSQSKIEVKKLLWKNSAYKVRGLYNSLLDELKNSFDNTRT